MLTSQEIKNIKDDLCEHGLITRRIENMTKKDFIQLGKELSSQKKLVTWDFGEIMEMKYDKTHQNYLFSDEGVPLHWDGAFFQEPQYILFYCTDIGSVDGGESLFTNTTKLFHSLTDDEKEKVSQIKVQYKTQKLAHYGGEINVHLKQVHPTSGEPILRVAAEVKTSKNPVLRTTLNDEENLCHKLDVKALHSEFCYEHKWSKGDLLIADNFTFLHGRNPLGKNLKRSFLRVQAL